MQRHISFCMCCIVRCDQNIVVCAGAEFVIAGSGGDTFRAQGMYAHPGHSKVVLRSPYQHASILLKTAQKGPFYKTQVPSVLFVSYLD